MKTKFVILFTVFIITSCKEEIPSMKQKIYFEMHYVNYAWLPQSSGYLIDSVGNVLTFKWVEVFHEWYEPDSTGYISAVNMDKNISFCHYLFIYLSFFYRLLIYLYLFFYLSIYLNFIYPKRRL